MSSVHIGMFREGNSNTPSQSKLKYWNITQKGVMKVKEYRTQIMHVQIYLNASGMLVINSNELKKCQLICCEMVHSRRDQGIHFKAVI